jgi:M6 family metalloprotease-like protein
MKKIFVTFMLVLLTLLTASAADRRKGVGCWRTIPKRHAATSRMMQQQRVKTGDVQNCIGTKRGLVILCEFQDRKFAEGNTIEKYNDILNKEDFTSSEGFRGSVADYFRAQSGGLFNLTFDIVGPYTTKKTAIYYGKNDSEGNDQHPDEMIMEMCKAADDVVNFADYDWDGDGEVDEVFVVYAGKGEADTGSKSYIWPHMWTFDEAEVELELDGIKINTYACANELKSSGRINGIGTFCHEFSHCLGLPDFYDIDYSGNFGMGDFDLMSGGNYAGNTFCPVGYTAYEKMVCGWQQPIVLSEESVTVDNILPISEGGDTYIIYNDNHSDEYYLIENRQKTGWDSHYPARGLMITHVDFDAEVWENNIPNTVFTLREAQQYGLTVGNDHQRMTFFHADDDDDRSYWSFTGQYYWMSTTDTDLYPQQGNDSLTATSAPAATLFHNNSAGTKLMQGAILDIHQNSDGTMGFRFRATDNSLSVGIKEVDSPTLRSSHIYTLDGRDVGTDWNALAPGLYIVDGRKRFK